MVGGLIGLFEGFIRVRSYVVTVGEFGYSKASTLQQRGSLSVEISSREGGSSLKHIHPVPRGLRRLCALLTENWQYTCISHIHEGPVRVEQSKGHSV
jgi:hypothetical protein